MSSSSRLINNLEDAKRFLHSKTKDFPRFVVVLGSGLACMLDQIEIEQEISYDQIPHLLSPTVEGHKGRLLIGTMHGMRIACMQGRLHYYEGHLMENVVFPFRALAFAGAEIFLLTNASGGLHSKMKPGEFMLIEDHINLMGTNPLIGENLESIGTRFPDLSQLYDRELGKIIISTAKRLKTPLRRGVYVAIHGPSYETPAEIRMHRKLGADVVGMSTVPEAIALHHMGKRVAAISCITNLAAGVTKAPLDHKDVLEIAKKVQNKFSRLVIESLRAMEKKVGKLENN
jgi:purine-nucleoside phosphorylase